MSETDLQRWDDEVALDKLRQEPLSPADEAYLDEARAELETAHQKAASEVLKLTVTPDGVVVGEEERKRILDSGDRGGVYGSAGRRS